MAPSASAIRTSSATSRLRGDDRERGSGRPAPSGAGVPRRCGRGLRTARLADLRRDAPGRLRPERATPPSRAAGRLATGWRAPRRLASSPGGAAAVFAGASPRGPAALARRRGPRRAPGGGYRTGRTGHRGALGGRRCRMRQPSRGPRPGSDPPALRASPSSRHCVVDHGCCDKVLLHLLPVPGEAGRRRTVRRHRPTALGGQPGRGEVPHARRGDHAEARRARSTIASGAVRWAYLSRSAS